jgi:hypothetical protein
MFETWSTSERRGIAAAFATACLACLAWAFPNMTRLITIPGAVATGILTLYLLWPEIKSVSVSLSANWEPGTRTVKGGRLRGLLGLALLVAILGTGYAGSHWRPTTGLDQGEPPKAGQSETAWVSTQEIETQRKAGRVLLTISPGELANMYVLQGGAEAVAPYKDSWVKVDYPFYQLMHDPTGPDPAVLRISGTTSGFVVAYFPSSVHDKLLQLRFGDRVHAICQVNRIDQGFFANTYATRLIVYACEFI